MTAPYGYDYGEDDDNLLVGGQDDETLQALLAEEGKVEDYQTSDQSTMTSILNEFVKSYGFSFDNQGVHWSPAKIAESFQEHPFWTSLDYLTLFAGPARFGLAARQLGKGAYLFAGLARKTRFKALEGVIGETGAISKALREGEFAAGGSLFHRTEKGAQTKLGRVFGAFGMAPEKVAATEMYLGSGVRRSAGVYVPGVTKRTGRFYSLPGIADVNVDDDLMKLWSSDKFGMTPWETKGLMSSIEREKKTMLAANMQRAVSINRMRKAALAAGETEQDQLAKLAQLSDDTFRPTNMDDWLAHTFQWRNEIHESSYELKLFGEETYLKNLFKNNPTAYKEWEEMNAALSVINPKSRKVAGRFVEPDSIMPLRPGLLNADEVAQREAFDMGVAKGRKDFGAPPSTGQGPATTRMQGGVRHFAKKGEEAPEYLTKILDPEATLSMMAKAANVVAGAKYARLLAKSPLVATRDEAIEQIIKIVNTGDTKAMLAHGITSEKWKYIQEYSGLVNKTSREASAEELLKDLGWMSSDEFVQRVPAWADKLPEELRGKYIDPNVAHELVDQLKYYGEDSEMWNAYKGMMNWWRTSKTAYNPAGTLRNILGNHIFSFLATGDPRKLFGIPLKGIRAFREGDIKKLTRAAEAGVINSSFSLAEVKDLLNKTNLQAKTALDWLPAGRVSEVLKGGARNAEWFYRTVDDVYKLDTWLSLSEKYAKRYGQEAAEKMASVELAKYMPTFLQQSDFAKTVGAVVPFSGFVTEALRSWKNVMLNAPMRGWFVNHFFDSMSGMTAMLGGFTPEELQSAKDTLPGYMKNHKSLMMYFQVDGKPQFLDMSYIIPMGNIEELFNPQGRGIGEILDPTANPFIGTAVAATANYDLFRGKEIQPQFTERNLGAVTNPIARRAVGFAEHLIQTWAPPWVPPSYVGTNLLEAIRGDVDPQTNERLEENRALSFLGNLAGLRLYSPGLKNVMKSAQLEEKENGDRINEAWNRWNFARANGDVQTMAKEHQRLVYLRAAKFGDDLQQAEEYFVKGARSRLSPYSNVSTRQLKKFIEEIDESGGTLSEQDRALRSELVARYQQRRNRE